MSKFLKPEIKHHDQDYTAVGYEAVHAVNAISNAADYYRLEKIAEGDDYNTRDGRKIFIRNVEIGGWLQLGNSDLLTDAWNFARVSILKVSPEWITEEFPNYTLLNRLQEHGSDAGSYIQKIYYDNLFCLDPYHQFAPFPRWIKINDYFTYDGTQDESGNSLLVMVSISDSAEVPHPGIVKPIGATIRVYYNDC